MPQTTKENKVKEDTQELGEEITTSAPDGTQPHGEPPPAIVQMSTDQLQQLLADMQAQVTL